MSKTKVSVSAPGRINIIGEHTDYNNGFVLPAAIDKKIKLHIEVHSNPNQAWVEALDLGENFTFDIRSFRPLVSGWQNYVMGVVSELQKLGAQIPGFIARFKGEIPIGSGLSSSAALECSFASGLNDLFSLGFNKSQLIEAAQMAEHNFVGIKCGIMDQFASVMGRKDQVILLDCQTLQHRYFPLVLEDHTLLLLNSNVTHELASSEYNTRRSECEEGVSIIQKRRKEVKSLRDVDISMLNSAKADLPSIIYQRCHHVVTENARVIEATHALEKGDYTNLGALMYGSHTSLSRDYAVSCPELDFLVDTTRELPYVLGSRMMGGGFGGCTINLLEEAELDGFLALIATKYRKEFDKDLTPIHVKIDDGVLVNGRI